MSTGADEPQRIVMVGWWKPKTASTINNHHLQQASAAQSRPGTDFPSPFLFFFVGGNVLRGMACQLGNNREGVEKIRNFVSIQQGLVHQMLNARGSILLCISHARIMSSLEPPGWDYENLLLPDSCLRHDAHIYLGTNFHM